MPVVSGWRPDVCSAGSLVIMPDVIYVGRLPPAGSELVLEIGSDAGCRSWKLDAGCSSYGRLSPMPTVSLDGLWPDEAL